MSWLVLGLGLLCGAPSHALITCTLAPPAAVNFAYVNNTDNTSPANLQQGAVNATCTRTSASDPTTLELSISDGLYRSGQTNFAQLSGFRISYDFYSDSACLNQWSRRNGSLLTLTLSNLSLNVPVTATFNYWACKPSAQNVSSFPSGVYTDRVDLTLSAGGTALATGSIAVNAYAPAVCSISHGPNTLTFSYQAFSTAAVFAGTSFRANCTNYLPYTISLGPASGVVGGLRYTLGVSLAAAGSAGNIGPPSVSTQGNATGFATHYINGSMAAGQAGQSGPLIAQTHQLTNTY